MGSKVAKAALLVLYTLCGVTGMYCVAAQPPFCPCDCNEPWHHQNTLLHCQAHLVK